MARSARRWTALCAGVAVASLVALAATSGGGAKTSPTGPGPQVHPAAAGGSPAAKPAALAGAASATGPSAAAHTTGQDVDVRHPTDPAAIRRAELRSAQLAARPAVRRLVHTLGRQAIVDIDPLTGTPRQVARLDGLLTAPSSAAPATIALGYVQAHSAAFGLDGTDLSRLHLANDYVDIQGTHHLSFTQSADGVPVFDNGLKANVTKRGQLVNITGSPVHGLTAPAAAARSVDATSAIATAKRGTGERDTSVGPDDTAKAVLFQTATGPRRAWQTVTMSADHPALTVVDATTGAVLYRDRLDADLASTASTDSAATPAAYSAKVYDNYPGASAGGTAHIVGLTANGWLPVTAQVLSGNNVHTYTDVNGDDVAGATEEVKPTGTLGYEFTLARTSAPGEPCSTNVCTWLPNTAYSWRAGTNASRTAAQNFYFINKWHDYLEQAPIGFTEAAGNFQSVNGSHLGKGGDPVHDEALSGAAIDNGLPVDPYVDNADFATPPDGQSPTMRMFLFHEPHQSAAGDSYLPVAGSDSADIVYHEYTHGLSHRLVVDATDDPALDSTQGQSMGEAWSDWYGLDYLVDQGLMPDNPATPDVIEGRYVLGAGSTTGIRTMPIDCPVASTATACRGLLVSHGRTGGYTYADVPLLWQLTQDVHTVGEVWAQTLWDLRANLVTSLGQSAGTQLAESLVTRGMELSPTYPSMLDMRNGIIAADQADYAGAHVAALWTVFAARGMGFFASSQGGDDTTPTASFAVPPAAGSPTGTLTGTVTNTAGGGPLPGVTIGFSGHDSGFPGDYVATTDSQGEYSIPDLVPGTYPAVYATGGVDRVTRALTIAPGTNQQDWALARDWASSSGGGRVAAYSGVNRSSEGCGPDAAIDLSPATGWASSTQAGAPVLILELASYVDVTTLAVNPSSACSDAPGAALKSYTLDTSTDGVTWRPAATGSFGSSDVGHLVTVQPAATATQTVRWVRLTMLSPQVSAGALVDIAELEVYGALSPGPAQHNHQGGAPPRPR